MTHGSRLTQRLAKRLPSHGSPASAPMDRSLESGFFCFPWEWDEGVGRHRWRMAGGSAGARCPPSPAWEGAGADSPRARTLETLPTCPHGDVVPAAIRASRVARIWQRKLDGEERAAPPSFCLFFALIFGGFFF